jgi:hypothetical protein
MSILMATLAVLEVNNLHLKHRAVQKPSRGIGHPSLLLLPY